MECLYETGETDDVVKYGNWRRFTKLLRKVGAAMCNSDLFIVTQNVGGGPRNWDKAGNSHSMLLLRSGA